eukprot:TRINITY_DN3729_c0_g1_i6.p1 TRINITY_DN3729_c0_g1~~TRINITY_DN3729_c0_g1_i6.p1  ORF type:complete len:144 (-),score=39.23 TRINITY_DN3729_c0_g1_i6:34-465(-)
MDQKVEKKDPGEEEDEEEEGILFKVVVVGDGAVGKTSLLNRFTQDYFVKKYKQTIGVDFFVKQVTLPGGVQVGLQLCDIGGQNVGSKMIKNYLFGAHAVLFVYDITNYASFQNVQDWLEIVERSFPDQDMPRTVFVANKSKYF